MNYFNNHLKKNLLSVSNTVINLLCSMLLLIFTTAAIAQNNQWENYNSSNSPLPSNSVLSVLCGENSAWLGTDNGLAFFNGRQWNILQMQNSGLPGNFIFDIAREENGALWFATDMGLAKLHNANDRSPQEAELMGQWTVYTYLNSPLPINSIRCITIDSHGNKWIGTWGAGLLKFDDQNWTLYNTGNSGLPNNGINFISVDQNDNVWIGTFSGGLALMHNGNWIVYNTENSLLQSNNVKAIGFDRNNITWVCTNNGIIKINGKQWTSINSSVTNFEFQTVYDVVCGTSIWFASDHGLIEFDGRQWKNFRVNNSALPTNDIRTLSMDLDNNVWIGTAGKGLEIYNTNGVALAIENPVNSLNAMNVFPNPASDEITFSFTTNVSGKAELALYDILGKKVCTLLNEEVGAGKHELKFDTNTLPAGVYVLRIRLKDRIDTMRIAMI